MENKKFKRSILIASYLESEHVERIKAIDKNIVVHYKPDLLRTPRYPADHNGNPITRTQEEEFRWQTLLNKAEILFDFDQTHLTDLPDLAPNVKWIQATSAGIGQMVKRLEYDTRMPTTIFTTASGIHSQPLAEFCLMSMLMYSRGLTRMLKMQSQKHWERYAGTDLIDRTVVIIGMGNIGQKVTEIAKSFGMKVIGIKRTISETDLMEMQADQILPANKLQYALKQADYLILCMPHTPETEHMIGETELNLLPKGAMLINIARGTVVDETALIKALEHGHLGGAALDVFQTEPLPKDSPLWNMPNVLVSPHSGSTSERENSRLTDLFCHNLRQYLDNKPLLNVLDTNLLY